jgi:hypothetical protein
LRARIEAGDVVRCPNNPNRQKPCKRERGPVLQVKPLFKWTSKESEQHRNEHGTEGQDENAEKQVEECKECKGYEKREAIPDEALRAGFCRAFFSDRVHPKLDAACQA